MYCKVLLILAIAAIASGKDLFVGSNDTTGLKVFEGHFEASNLDYLGRPAKEVFVNVSGPITSINVTDLRELKDGEATIVSGGIGHENVTISLKSPAAFRGYDFFIEVYSKDEEVQRGPRNTDNPQEVQDKTPEPLTNEATSTTAKPTEERVYPGSVKSVTESRSGKREVTSSTPKPSITSSTTSPVTGYTGVTGPTFQHKATGFSTTSPEVTGFPTGQTGFTGLPTGQTGSSGKPMHKIETEMPGEIDMPTQENIGYQAPAITFGL